MNFNLNFRRRKPEPVDEGCRIEYLGIDQRPEPIRTDLVIQKGTKVEVVFKAVGLVSSTIYSSSADGSPYKPYSFFSADWTSRYNKERIYMCVYGQQPEDGLYRDLSHEQWHYFYTNSDNILVFDEESISVQSTTQAINQFPVRFFEGFIANSEDASVFIQYAKITIDNVTHHLVPWRIGNKGYLKDLTTGTIYGNGEGYILGPDVDEEVGE